jgi:hypothetical protein
VSPGYDRLHRQWQQRHASPLLSLSSLALLLGGSPDHTTLTYSQYSDVVHSNKRSQLTRKLHFDFCYSRAQWSASLEKLHITLTSEPRYLGRYSDGLRAGLPRGRFPAGYLSLLLSVQTGSEAHPASYSVGTGSAFSGCKTAVSWS